MKDEYTLLLRRIADILLVKNPVGTSLGALAGVVLHGIFFAAGIFQLEIYYFIALGVFLFNIKPFLSGRHKIPNKVEAIFSTIDGMFNDNLITHNQRKGLYRRAVNEYIEESFSKSKQVEKKQLDDGGQT